MHPSPVGQSHLICVLKERGELISCKNHCWLVFDVVIIESADYVTIVCYHYLTSSMAYQHIQPWPTLFTDGLCIKIHPPSIQLQRERSNLPLSLSLFCHYLIQEVAQLLIQSVSDFSNRSAIQHAPPDVLGKYLLNLSMQTICPFWLNSLLSIEGSTLLSQT